MRKIFGVLAIALAALAVTHVAGPATAQEQAKQIRLTDQQVQGYIASSKEMTAATAKLQGDSDKPDPKVIAQLEGIVKKHGFASLNQYDEVAANISLVFALIDPKTKAVMQPQELIRKEIAEVNADASIPAEDKKQTLAELNEALKSAQPVQFPENVALVKKYYDKIDATLQDG